MGQVLEGELIWWWTGFRMGEETEESRMRLLALEAGFEWMTVLSTEKRKRKSGGRIELLGVTRPGGGHGTRAPWS